MILTMDAKRRLTVPVGLAPAKPGDMFEVLFDVEEDAIVFRRISPDVDWVEVFKQCPVSMDDVPPRRREYFKSKI
jgi:hypothetical protein